MLTLPKYFIYIVYTGILALMLIAVIPRQDIKRLAIYGIIFGAVMDGVLIVLVSHILGLGGYLHYGPLGFMGIPLFPLFAWTAYFILYFYFLPEQKPFLYIYTLAAAAYSTLLSNVLENLGIFKWNYGRLLVPFIIYTLWHVAVTWAYGKLQRMAD
ncbi:MAG: hypothetical protein H0Z35_03710 [Thermoanaerobacteraceae bacterium]|nr:hypothetical protein [Thermoanaerobacteraceae bacterium]